MMVHIAVLILSIQISSSILFVLGHGMYAIVLVAILCPIIVYKIFFHFKRPFLFLIYILATSVLVFNYCDHRIQKYNEEYNSGFALEDSQTLEINGVIDEFPSYRYSNNQYVISDQDTDARVLVFLPFHQKLKYSEEIIISGKVKSVLKEEKKWHQYYRKLGVHYVMFNPIVRDGQRPSLPQSHYTTLKTKLFTFKSNLRSHILQTFSSHTTALMLGMLFGEKDELSKEEKDMFNKVGISHILVVSGYNIALLIVFMFFLLKRANRFTKRAMTLCVIALFVLLIGFDGSVLRAALMGSIIIFSKIAQRPSSALNILFIVACLLLLYNPLLIYDAGFHLSCIATASLLLFPRIPKIPEFILTTTWVFIWVAPYIMYLSARFALISIITNILILSLLPLFMITSLISLIISYTSIYLGIDILILESISRYIFFVSKLSAEVSALTITISPPQAVAIYGTTLSIILFQKNKYTPVEFMNKHYQKFLPQKPN